MRLRMRAAGMLALLLVASVCMAAPATWKAATFRGLTMGRSNREAAIHALGNPDATQKTKDGEELTYRGRGDHKGDLTVRIDRSGVVTQIEEALPVAIPRTRIYKEFGASAMTAHYSAAKCAGGELYRDPRGGIELTLFPAQGIALWPDQYGYDFAAIHYTARQPGLTKAPACVGAHK